MPLNNYSPLKFLLTEGPHLYYVDPVTMHLKGEVPFSEQMRTETKNFRTFFVHTVLPIWLHNSHNSSFNFSPSALTICSTRNDTPRIGVMPSTGPGKSTFSTRRRTKDRRRPRRQRNAQKRRRPQKRKKTAEKEEEERRRRKA